MPYGEDGNHPISLRPCHIAVPSVIWNEFDRQGRPVGDIGDHLPVLRARSRQQSFAASANNRTGQLTQAGFADFR